MSESGECQLGILDEFLLEAKSKMASGDFVLRNIFASKPLRNTLLVYPCFQGQLMKLCKTKVVCITRFQDGRHKYEKWRFRPQFRPG